MNLPHHHPPPPSHSSSVTSYQTFRLLTTLFLVLVVSQFFLSTVSAIDCFKCVSVNGENPACEDPFHNNFTSDLLESPCLGGRKGRNGLFPATACLKLAGRYADGNYEKMVIRTCALDSGTLTLDTELVRMSHCGSFVLDGRYVNGCLQSCDDGDGCNSAPSDRPGWLRIVTAAASVITISLIWANVMPSYHVFR
ncbi:uncharacterized protein LOC124192179 isoform X3 [Daphnia pulex]|uniref:uncharacterized protein LOC124192179 isoform X3 n=1 Tax=Daphnia pulex TaxID=6669 RepID=UPI001EDF4858|nr:uncharacterized protein LOC124192179 isoform X3 [Daphnia pulex]